MQSNLVSTPLFLKLKKIQGLFKDLHRNSRTFQGKMEFKEFSRTPPKIQGLFKTVRTLQEQVLECLTYKISSFLNPPALIKLLAFQLRRNGAAMSFSRPTRMISKISKSLVCNAFTIVLCALQTFL